jgi:hypothetical protein
MNLKNQIIWVEHITQNKQVPNKKAEINYGINRPESQLLLIGPTNSGY